MTDADYTLPSSLRASLNRLREAHPDVLGSVTLNAGGIDVGYHLNLSMDDGSAWWSSSAVWSRGLTEAELSSLLTGLSVGLDRVQPSAGVETPAEAGKPVSVDLGAGNDHSEASPPNRSEMVNAVALAIRDVNIAEHLEMMSLTVAYRMAEKVLDRLLALIPRMANLGYATTRELLAEISARIEVDHASGGGGLDYRTVGVGDDRMFLYSQRALIVRMCEAVGIDMKHEAGISAKEWKAAADAAIERAASLADNDPEPWPPAETKP